LCLGVGPEPLEIFESGASYVVANFPGVVHDMKRVTQKMVDGKEQRGEKGRS
jgi:hypothetical protein